MNLHKIFKSWFMETLVLITFSVAFYEHISVAMYLLAAVIFYFYIPRVYVYSRVNIFNHITNKEFIHLKYYPLEFVFWLFATCFFAFILAHLLADLAYGVEKHVHYMVYILIFIDLAFITRRELAAKKLQFESLETNYEQQGWLLAFEILFAFIMLFMMPH